MEPLFFIVLPLIIGAGTRHFMKRSPLPYTVLLFVFGIGLGLVARIYTANLSGPSIAQDQLFVLDAVMLTFLKAIKWAGNIDPHIIMFAFLPILIFEAAFLDISEHTDPFKTDKILLIIE
jgi:hypothetical protein